MQEEVPGAYRLARVRDSEWAFEIFIPTALARLKAVGGVTFTRGQIISARDVAHKAQLLDATEASGVTRLRDELLIVSDAAPGTVYRFSVERDAVNVISISPDKLRATVFASSALALDFEAVDVLADGRVVALSERLRALVAEDGIVVQYDDPFGELGERGLEGLAVRTDGQESVVAVLWEGGYPGYFDLPAQLREQLGGKPLKPVVFVHDLEANTSPGKVKIHEGTAIELSVPTPPDSKHQTPPMAQRFRAPDLVWHSWRGDARENIWGFIVLLNSQNSPLPPLDGTVEKATFGPRWLQRFDLSGNPVGDPIDIDSAVRGVKGDAVLDDANWEGLGWFETGESLVLVHDKKNKLPDGNPAAVILPLPEGWRHAG